MRRYELRMGSQMADDSVMGEWGKFSEANNEIARGAESERAKDAEIERLRDGLWL